MPTRSRSYIRRLRTAANGYVRLRTATNGFSQIFDSSVSGGVSPFTYQWYLDDAPVSSATASTWVFTPTSTGSYEVYLKVTDDVGVTAESNVASVTVNPTLSVSIFPISFGRDKKILRLMNRDGSNITDFIAFF